MNRFGDLMNLAGDPNLVPLWVTKFVTLSQISEPHEEFAAEAGVIHRNIYCIVKLVSGESDR